VGYPDSLEQEHLSIVGTCVQGKFALVHATLRKGKIQANRAGTSKALPSEEVPVYFRSYEEEQETAYVDNIPDSIVERGNRRLAVACAERAFAGRLGAG
jgi:hypothetical protein